MLRSTLGELLVDVKTPVAVAVSAGIDSASLAVVLAVDLDLDPIAVSFTLDDRESSDLRGGRRVAGLLDLLHETVYLPTDPEVVDAGIRRAVACGVRGKAAIECVWPFLYTLDRLAQLRIRTLVTGSAADGHFGLSKKAMIHARSTLFKFDVFRNQYFADPDRAQVSTLRRLGAELGVDVRSPYFAPDIFRLFIGRTWDELNRPVQKQAIRDEFPELETLRIGKHTNLQLGDSGIAELLGDVATSKLPGSKSSIAYYNRLARGLEARS
jgi:asparagine synthetase B (glutamine-hydrolysing)